MQVDRDHSKPKACSLSSSALALPCACTADPGSSSDPILSPTFSVLALLSPQCRPQALTLTRPVPTCTLTSSSRQKLANWSRLISAPLSFQAPDYVHRHPLLFHGGQRGGLPPGKSSPSRQVSFLYAYASLDIHDLGGSSSHHGRWDPPQLAVEPRPLRDLGRTR